MGLGHLVENRTSEPVLCSITNKTNPSGSTSWYEIHPGANIEWGRSGWEDVCFKSKDNSRQKSLWINRGSPAMIYFNGFDMDITIHNDYNSETFLVNNQSSQAVSCCITTNSGGNGGWFRIKPGENEIWKRSG